MKCYKCSHRIYKKYNYCPNCGGLMTMVSKKRFATTLSDSAQMNRVEEKLDIIIKGLK